MKRIITLGSLMRDCFLHTASPEVLHLQTTDQELSFIVMQEGKKVLVTDITYALGGGAANSATSFARLGHAVTICGHIANDQEGSWILSQLQKQIAETSQIKTLDNGKTGTSYVIPCPSGNRSIFVHRGVNETIANTTIAQSLYLSHDALYCASLNGPAALHFSGIVKAAKENGLFVASNPGSHQITTYAEQVIQALPYVDILIVNAYEAQTLLREMQLAAAAKQEENSYGIDLQSLPELLRDPTASSDSCFALQSFFKTVAQYGPRVVIITNGAEGVYVAHKDQIFFHPSIPAPVVSTVGAGDAFGSAFVSTFLNTNDIRLATRAGVSNSCAIIQTIDAQSGLLNAHQLQECIATIDQDLLLVF